MPRPRSITQADHEEMLRLAAQGYSTRQIAAKIGRGITHGTVQRYLHRALPLSSTSSSLPDPISPKYEPYIVEQPGQWLILSDLHLPYHDPATITIAIEQARKRRVAGVLLNGDILDSHEISEHDKDPRAARYVEEIECGKQFLRWLRNQVPYAQIVLKEGNHEERLVRYIMSRAPAIFGLEGVSVPELLHCGDLGIEWVGDRRVIRLGALNVIHGHEYRGGISAPVNPARGVYLRARSVVMCGHWHRTSEHHERDIRGRSEAAWSIGCACSLSPRYAPLNNWNHGFALVHISKDGFVVENKRVIQGRLV